MKKRTKYGLLAVLGVSFALTAGMLAACGTKEHEHVYENWRVGTPATCTTGGTEIADCTVCGHEETRAVEALGHDWQVTGGVPATCTQEGTETLECSRCGLENALLVDALGHSWSETTRTEELIASAKCETEGERVVKCERCGELVHVPIPALGHSWVAEETTVIVEATCTEPGKLRARCGRCDFDGEVEIPAIGHDFETVFTIDKPATFEEAGEMSRHCVRCDEVTDVTEISKLESDKAMKYTFRVVRTNGDAITFAGITGTVYDAEGVEVASLKFSGGVAEANLLPAQYTVSLDTMPEGYTAETKYSVSWEEPLCMIALKGALLSGAPASGVKYVERSAMYDFTLTTISTAKRPQVETLTLSELLKTKKIVMLNFWYVGCQFCRYEFPGMEAAYGKYQDDVAIIAIDPVDESEEYIRSFVNDYGLSFFVAKDAPGLAARFNVSSYPTTVIIDGEGIVSEIHASALVNPLDYDDLAYCTAQFEGIFAKYSATSYSLTGASAVDYALPEHIA